MLEIPENAISVGYLALREQLKLKALPHFRLSYILQKGTQKTIFEQGQEIHFYPKRYSPKDPENIFCQLEFALKYDGIHLGILKAVFEQISIEEMTFFVKEHPSSKTVKRLWYLYEFLLGKKLEVKDIQGGSYVLLLDPKIYYTGKIIRSRRHYIDDNLLGNVAFCPLLRRTSELLDYENTDFKEIATSILKIYNPELILRATNYLYLKETRSSYEIEREEATKKRLARFVELLKTADRSEYFSKEKLIELQNYTVDPRFADKDFRKSQNYVGETISYIHEKIHYIPPKPEDVERLMNGLFQCYFRMVDSQINPVLIASAISFGFVFIHPFEDGNGRLHRFLVHHILSRLKLTPDGLIFPISATMLNHLREYDQCLEGYSIPLIALLEEYEISQEGELKIEANKSDYYSYIDFTAISLYLFGCVEKTIQNDFRNQLEYLVRYDQTKKEVQEVIDMPDRLIDLIIKLILSNQGTLSKTKKQKYFAELTSEEIESIENSIQKQMLSKNFS